MNRYSGLFGSAVMTVCLLSAGGFAAPQQIGDFRLNSGAFPSTVRFDPSFSGFTTRSSGGPVNISSSFSGTSGLANGELTNDDIGLRTSESNTRILRLSRASTVRNGHPTVTYAGAVQLNFDFGTTLSTYLSEHNLQLDALYIRLELEKAGANHWYDVYLSYTSAEEAITLTGISTGSETSDSDIYSTFVSPAGRASAGDVIDGKFKLLEKGKSTDTDQIYSLLSAYNAGAREFNVIFSSGSFWGFSDELRILNSGIFIETSGGVDPQNEVFFAFAEPWTDPSNNMAVSWVSDSEAVKKIEYRIAGTSFDWESSGSQRTRPFPGLLNRFIHTAHLTGLQPDSVYEVRWPEVSFTDSFKTAPTSSVKVAFLSDYQKTDFGPSSALANFGAVLSEREPHLLVLVGDYVNCDGRINSTWAGHWYDFISGLSQYHRTKEGALVPMIALTGNHEGRADGTDGTYSHAMQFGTGEIGLIADLFSWSYDKQHPVRLTDSAATVSIGSELFLIGLNTDHTESLTDQMDWLSEQLAQHADRHRHVVVAGHGVAFTARRSSNWTAHSYARILRNQAWPIMAPHADRIRFYICGHQHILSITDKLRMDINPALTEEENDRRWATDPAKGIRQIGCGPWAGNTGRWHPADAVQTSLVDGSTRFLAMKGINEVTKEVSDFGSGIKDAGDDIRHVWFAHFDEKGFSANALNVSGEVLYEFNEHLPRPGTGLFIGIH